MPICLYGICPYGAYMHICHMVRAVRYIGARTFKSSMTFDDCRWLLMTSKPRRDTNYLLTYLLTYYTYGNHIYIYIDIYKCMCPYAHMQHAHMTIWSGPYDK